MRASPRVLIVESGDSIGRLLAVALAQEGYEVLQAETADEVSMSFASLRPDVVLFNTGPSFDEKARYIDRWRELSPASKIVEIGYPLSRPAGAGGSPDAYETYPFRLEALIDKINRLAGRSGIKTT
jgi:two-component system KDP operon response regulator KdpE